MNKMDVQSDSAREEDIAKAKIWGSLYYTLDECYVYMRPGNPDGNPIDDSDIKYDTEKDELLELDLTQREGNYVRINLPISGWVYLPKDKEDHEYEQSQLSNKKSSSNDKKVEKKSNDPDDAQPDLADEAEYGQQLDFGDENEDERRDYLAQRIQKLEEEVEPAGEVNKMLQIEILRKLVFLFRRNPFLPGLIVLVIQGVIEIIIGFDVYSDVSVAWNLYEYGQFRFFTVSVIFILAPYLIAWCAVSEMAARKLVEHRNDWKWHLLIMVFDVAPLGAFMLFLNDIYHLIECIAIKPIYYLLTGGKAFRTISYEELGYYKLRRVSEIFAESFCQALLQTYILLFVNLDSNACGNCNPGSVIIALISSVFVAALWTLIIFIESSKNGMNFFEYVCVVFQGSFKFVPQLPAIERGSKSGKKVNWTYYKLNADGVGHVGKALLSRNCRLTTIKISTYTLSSLHRYGARYLGSMIRTSPRNINVIISRLEEDVRGLFEEYDTDNDWSFDYNEFARVSLALKKDVKERCIRSDINDLYSKLADSVLRKVWLLDLLLKVRGSLERIPLLDFDLPLEYAYDTDNLKLMSFLMNLHYDDMSDENKLEFQTCVTRAVTYDPDDLDNPDNPDNLQENEIKQNNENGIQLPKRSKESEINRRMASALCLCEQKGVPIVVRIIRGNNLLPMDEDGKSDPYVRVDCAGIEERTSIKKQTLNPIWEEDLLFILPFETADVLLASKDSNNKNENENKDNGFDASNKFHQNAPTTANLLRNGGMSATDLNVSHLPSYYSKYRLDLVTSGQPGQQLEQLHEHMTSSQNDLNELGSSPDVLDKADSTGSMLGDLPQSQTHLGGSLASGNLGDVARRRQLSKYAQDNAKKGKLVFKFKIHDYDANDEDDFMGSYKLKVDTSDDTSEFHKKILNIAIRHLKFPDGAGTLQFKVYLNALQFYQNHGTQFIEVYGAQQSSEQREEEKMIEKMEKGNDREQAYVFQV